VPGPTAHAGTAGDPSSDHIADTPTRAAGHTSPGKGRPTPKRRDAETKRRGPAPTPPRTQREAQKLARKNRASRDERRKDSADRRARLLAGDDSALPLRDRGPVKAFARDVVDSRRRVMGLFMPLAGLVFISLLAPIAQARSLFSVFAIAMLIAMAAEGLLLGRQLTGQARARFPDQRISGLSLGWYAFTRASQLRKLRGPKPRVSPGATL